MLNEVDPTLFRAQAEQGFFVAFRHRVDVEFAAVAAAAPTATPADAIVEVRHGFELDVAHLVQHAFQRRFDLVSAFLRALDVRLP